MRRVGMIAAALLIAFAFNPRAWAQSGTCSDTSLAPGDPISVSGSGAAPGETATLRFEGNAIGASTVDGFGNFSVGGNIPGSTPPGVYTISVTFTTSATIVPCSVTVQDAAPEPTDDPDDDDEDEDEDEDEEGDDEDEDDDEDDDGQQQQQQGPFGGQQQQQGPGGGQQQQQQQQLVVPASFSVPERVVHHSAPTVVASRSLPKTGMGIDLEDVTGVSTGSLLVGFSLMELARRHRRRRDPALAGADGASVREDRFLCEGDLLLPRWDEPSTHLR